jgi:predicted transcriptional regulator
MSKEGDIMTVETQLNQIKQTLDTLLDLVVPEWISVSDLAKSLQKDTSTIRKYIKNNFEPDVQYKQDTEHGKIMLRKDAMLQTRSHYGK